MGTSGKVSAWATSASALVSPLAGRGESPLEGASPGARGTTRLHCETKLVSTHCETLEGATASGGGLLLTSCRSWPLARLLGLSKAEAGVVMSGVAAGDFTSRFNSGLGRFFFSGRDAGAFGVLTTGADVAEAAAPPATAATGRLNMHHWYE